MQVDTCRRNDTGYRRRQGIQMDTYKWMQLVSGLHVSGVNAAFSLQHSDCYELTIDYYLQHLFYWQFNDLQETVSDTCKHLLLMSVFISENSN